MTNCNFNPDTCNINCPKYPMCSHGNIEHQLTEIQTQISTIYSTLTKIVLRQKETEENLENIVALVNDIFQDSQKIQNNFLESNNEKIY